MSTVARGLSYLRRRGMKAFFNRALDYTAGYLRYRLFPGSDKRNTNWHRYIRDLDARAVVMAATPWKLEIESTSVCNLQCIMCSHVFAPPRTGKHFDVALLDRLSAMLPAAGEFQLMGSGEPLISPAFWKTMDFIAGNPSRIRAHIGISSNGAAMTPHMIEKLLRSPLHEISFSLDAASPETYRAIRNGDFVRTIDNIRRLIRRRNELGKFALHIMLNMTLMRRNIDELPAFVELAKSLGADAVQFWPLHDYSEISKDNWTVERNGWVFKYREQMFGHTPEDAAAVNARIDQAVELAEKSGMHIIWPMGGKTHVTPLSEGNVAQNVLPASAGMSSDSPPQDAAGMDCVAPWEWMLVDVQGNVRPCCYISKSFGNIRAQRPEDIWNGAEYQEMRLFLAQGKLPPVCHDAACRYARGNRFYE